MTYNRINLMLPTYCRSHTQLPRFLASALKQAADKRNICFTLVVKQSDHATKRVVEDMLNGKADYCFVEEDLPEPHLAKYFNMAYEQTDFIGDDIVVSMLGDDMVFETFAWDMLLLKHINAHDGLGIFYGDDMWSWHEKLCVNLFTTRRYVGLWTPLPYMCEMYPRDMIDIVHQRVAEALGMAHYIQELRIRHNHATANGQFMDDVFRRLKTQNETVQKNADKFDDYVAECVSLALKAINDRICADIDVVMTTHNRLPLLMQTAISYSKSGIRPKRLHVYDDQSDKPNAVKRTLEACGSEIIFQSRAENLGCEQSTPAALEHMFQEKRSKAVLVLDSDTQYAPGWWLRINELYGSLSGQDDFGSITMLNLPDNPKGVPADTMQSLLVKPHWGACGALITREFWERYILPLKKENYRMWDNRASQAASDDGLKNYCTTPSLIQHTGVYHGTHTGGENAYSLDFLHDLWYISPHSRNAAVNAEERRVLFCCLARNGDIVMASMIANMLIDAGYHLTWLTMPRYEELVAFACPRARRVCQQHGLLYPGCDWHDMSTEDLASQHPGYAFYINAQPGAAENHAQLYASNLHMARFVKVRVEEIIGERLPENFIDYLRPMNAADEFVYQGDDPEKPLAIITPEVLSINNVMTDDVVSAVEAELAPDYNVRILVSKRPEGMCTRELRNRYIWDRKTFLDCIPVLMNARMFVGNDSGLAWASMYNRECKKRIYHSMTRLMQTNCWYGQIDPMAEDIIVELENA